MTQHNTSPIVTSTWAGYDAARTGAAMADRSDRGRIVLSGADRASYLHGMLTNDIVALQPGQGCYACYLTAQGRMISDMWLFELGDMMLMITPGRTRATVLDRLDQFIFSEDVQLGDVTDTWSSIALLGPEAVRALQAVVLDAPTERLAALTDGGNLRASVGGRPAILLRVGDAGVPAYELLVSRDVFEDTWRTLEARGAVPLSVEATEAIRVEGGVPRFHQDMDESTIPLEAGLERIAINLQKGCYVGQEVIIRVLHRGHGRVAKRLVGLTLSGAMPSEPLLGAAIQSADREVGRVTSATWSPSMKATIALGYVHRDYAAPDTAVTVAGAAAVVTAVPFVS